MSITRGYNQRLMTIRLISFLKQNNLLSKNQFGLRSCIDTEDAILNTTQFI
ncbi:Reverse transcriptase domain-containing protein [Aphis craccivora]|uniref:Reverse transcriptase domain-containing protein n=1 Tax=Aphis craccivora TaxID=307492 RepID=A0A6G0Y7T4_APHCR|nr:Reverse transcriptase domain-containing protein [Aphis craccivora]